MARRSCSRVSSSAPAHQLRAGRRGRPRARRGRAPRRPRRRCRPWPEPIAGGDPLGGEVALVALDRLQRLVLRPALEPLARPARRRCRRGAAPVRPPRAARARRLPPAARRRARARSAVEELLDLGLRHGADELVDDRAVAEGLHRRDPLDAEARRQRLVGVDVDLGQHHLAAAARLGRLQRRASAFAGPAPLGPEVDHDGGLPRELDHLALEGRFGDVDGHAAQISQARRRVARCKPLAYRQTAASVDRGRGQQPRRKDVERRCRPGRLRGLRPRRPGSAERDAVARTAPGSPPTSCRSAAKPKAATRSSGTSPRSPTTGHRSASSRRSSSTPASGWW